MTTKSEFLAREEVHGQIRREIESGQLVLNQPSRIVAEQVLEKVLKQAPERRH
jgi:hypothetical protein